MCGITGYSGSTLSRDEISQALENACSRLRHRGPDDEGQYIYKGVGLGVTRLAIRDPKNGKQPMSYLGSTIVFNGELYNSSQLKAKLIQKGHLFSTESDTEIFLHAYVEYGEEIINQLSGMFAFAIWNDHEQSLLLGRDRWGEKPLYYAASNGSMFFASEIDALKAWPGITWDKSLTDIDQFLTHSYIPGIGTGWKNVSKLAPGNLLTWKDSKLVQKNLFPSVHEKAALLQRQERTDAELFSLLNQSVHSCLVSDRPVGIFLSGGLDSSSVAVLASKHSSDLTLFSADWDEGSHSESTYFNKVASSLNLDHHIVSCTPSFFVDNFDFLVKVFGEPFADESMFPTHCLAKLAKEKVDVVLSGDGADEFFHGYERYAFSGNNKDYLSVFSAMTQEVKDLITNPSYKVELNSYQDIISNHYSQSNGFSDSIRLRSLVDIHTYLPYDILTKIDRASMSVGLEVRAPFLTPEITSFALGCSLQNLVGKRSSGKQILKNAMRSSLPSTITKRKKQGFGMPISNWFRTTLRDWMTHRMLNGELEKSGWFDMQGINHLILSHLSYKVDVSRPILNLLVLESWLRM